MAKIEVLHLTPTQRGKLHAFLRGRNLPVSVAQRIRIILLLDEGVGYRDIQEKAWDSAFHHLAMEAAI